MLSVCTVKRRIFKVNSSIDLLQIKLPQLS